MEEDRFIGALAAIEKEEGPMSVTNLGKRFAELWAKAYHQVQDLQENGEK